ncbi:Protein tyrosine kinase/Protein kinase domain containing protein [Novymonas esmeraldas]|uniref:Protein tyrosine kinase/Protein kinase domain containing protein n=1 Tax=Novymonas esmeraldas TaxID=1808958 RepID=A0AAW0F2I3_9TRYP
MLRGDYAGALAAYRGVADIADLEPGLLPAGMRREAAASAVTGGAASVQVARLVRECEERVRQRVTEPLCRVRLSWPGGERVLEPSADADRCAPSSMRGALALSGRLATAPEAINTRARSHSGDGGTEEQRFPAVRDRYVCDVEVAGTAFRTVVPSVPAWVRDQQGRRWHLPRLGVDGEPTTDATWGQRLLALGSTGVLSSALYVLRRDVHPVVAKRICGAPVGRMSDALRSAVPVCGPAAEQTAEVHRLLQLSYRIHHPNILPCAGYSHSVEGGVVLLYEFSPGGTLRELIHRYPRTQPVTLTRFGLQILSALGYLHERGIAHGRVSLDNVLVSADGTCRVTGHSGDRATSERLYHIRHSCYISPLMATGASATPQCDMFCYGLMIIEAETRQPAWRWATQADGQPRGTAEELSELMKEGGPRFSDALATGLVVANVELLNALLTAADDRSDCPLSLHQRCLSPDPAERPTAAQLWEASRLVLLGAGLALEDDASNITTGDASVGTG